MPRMALFLGIFLIGILLVPGVIQDAEAMTEAECLSLAGMTNSDGTKSTEAYYTVVTCETSGFDVTVYPGQRLTIQDPNGGSSGGMPWMHVSGHGETYSTGTYQYTDDRFDGTVRIVNTPNIGVSLENVSVSFSGSQMSVSGNIVNNNSFAVKDLYVMWDTGTGSVWQRYGGYDGQAYSVTVPAGGTVAFSETMCCGNGSTATPYIVQAFHVDGTPLINVPVYSGSAQITQLTLDSFSFFEDGTQTRYSASGDAPPSTNLTFTMTKPDGSDGDYNGSAGTGAPAYNHGGLISPTSSLMYGTWNLKICAPEYDMCVEKDFTINAPADPSSNVDLSFNLTPDITPYPSGTTSYTRGVGTGAQIQMQIVNTGTGASLDNWANVNVLAPDGSIFADYDVQFGYSIGPNSPHGAAWSHQIFDDSTALGTYTYTVTIDPENKVSETDETNNVHTRNL